MQLTITNPEKLRGRKLHWVEWDMEVTANLMTVDDSEYVFTCDVSQQFLRSNRRSKRFYLHLHRKTLRMVAKRATTVGAGLTANFSNPIFLRIDEVKDTDRLIDRMMHLINQII
jgi:hypothetical protein